MSRSAAFAHPHRSRVAYLAGTSGQPDIARGNGAEIPRADLVGGNLDQAGHAQDQPTRQDGYTETCLNRYSK
ncbi:MAG: hypothetical protein MJE77_29510 [Proteobacteria bacterium]|nr:hypothetical protein [Pseudomonadota bacterium]